MLRVYSGSLATEGYAQIQVERPSKPARGFAIRGYEEGSSTASDLLYSYHPDSPTGDVVVYKGRTNSAHSIQTQDSVKAIIDDKIEELLARIEELEMASGGQPENYRFTNLRVHYPRLGNTELWKQMSENQVLTSIEPWIADSQQKWEQEDPLFYVCLSNEWKLNPTGGYIISQQDRATYPRDKDVCNLTFSAVDSHPMERNGVLSTTHTVWRVEQTPTERKGTGSAFQSFDTDSLVAVTFYGGSLTKVTS